MGRTYAVAAIVGALAVAGCGTSSEASRTVTSTPPAASILRAVSLDDLHKYLTGSGLDCPDWHVTDASTSHISVGMCDADTMLAWTDEDQGQETAFRLYLGVGAQSMQKAQNDEPTTLGHACRTERHGKGT